MKFTASRLFHRNILFPPELIIDGSSIIINHHNGHKHYIDIAKIGELFTDKLGFRFCTLHIKENCTYSIKGLREKDAKRIFTEINLLQLSKITEWGDSQSILIILKCLTSTLKDLKYLRGCESRLLEELTNKIDEGLNQLHRC